MGVTTVRPKRVRWCGVQVAEHHLTVGVDPEHGLLVQGMSDLQSELTAAKLTGHFSPVLAIALALGELVHDDDDLHVQIEALRNRRFREEDGWDDPCRLALLAISEKTSDRVRAAHSRDTPQVILEILAEDPTPEVRKELIVNSACPLPVLERLIEHADYDLHVAAMTNDAVPPRKLLELYRLHESEINRSMVSALIRNKNTPGEVLDSLLSKPVWNDSYMLGHLAAHPNLPPQTQEDLAYHETASVRTSVAGNRNLDPEVAALVASDPDPEVRQKLASNERARVYAHRAERGEPPVDPEEQRREAEHRALRTLQAERRGETQTSAELKKAVQMIQQLVQEATRPGLEVA